MNFVGVLQEKCVKAKLSLPKYTEHDVLPDKTFKCICALEKWTTEGIGFSKKTAKQNAAKSMLSHVECEHILESTSSEKIKSIENAISKLYTYCTKEKQEKPLFSEKPDENGLTVVECSFNGFSGIGRGVNKKTAKEMSADIVLKHFNIYEYFDNLEKRDDRIESLKNSIAQLNELCQNRKLPIVYKEGHFHTESKSPLYEVTCTVGEFESKSSKNLSKKEAKIEAATLMLNLLHRNTPASSPNGKLLHVVCDELENLPSTKRAKIE